MFLNSDNTRGGVTDLTASLTIHRCKLSMGPQGVYQTVLERVGKDNYTQKYESRFHHLIQQLTVFLTLDIV